MSEDQFRFEAETHSYYLGDRRLTSVSEIIQSAGLKDFSMIRPDVMERAADRGTAVHAACHFIDQDDLDWATVSHEIEPYVRAWERFKLDTGIMEFSDIEKPQYHATFGFAGTPDRIIASYPISAPPERLVIDIKTYKPDAVTGVQLAAYSFLRFGPQPAWNEPQRWGVWLKEDGKYQIVEFKDRGDEAVFFACKTIHDFKRGNK